MSAVLVSLTLALVIVAVLSACIGQVPTSPLEVLGSILHRIGLDLGPMPAHPSGEVTLWEVRFPRVVLAICVGAALGCSGALLQGVFSNPLAEPGVIGVSAGAAVGASAVIVVGGTFVAGWAVAAAAFVAGLATTAAVYLLARHEGRTEVVTLVLTGVAINAFAGGLIAFFTFVASPSARDQIVFWQLGSLNGASWNAVLIVAPMTVVGIAATMMIAPRLDLLALGEHAARHLGVNVERLRQFAVLIVALLVSASVAFTGIILFVGLVVPHLMRILVGPGHRALIPASALAGALVLLVADLGSRSLIDNADLPLGMLTALVGGPFFFWLLRRTRAQQGGVGMSSLVRNWRELFGRVTPEPESPGVGDVTLEARDITVERGGRQILEGVSIEVRAGELVVLVGPNGAGKSTLLAALAGDQPVIAGRVDVDGTDLTQWSPIDMARRRAVLPQKHTIGFSFSARQVVRMGRAPWTGTRREDRDGAAITAAMKTCDVEGFANRPFAVLSGGEQARVALARVLAQETSTILLDEPTAALDLGHQEAVMSVARARAADGDAVVVVLHDLALAAAYADRIVVLENGRIAADGPPESVLHEELLTRVYGYPVEVFPHPTTGATLVIPRREFTEQNR